MNPQANLLNNAGILNTVMLYVEAIIRMNYPNTLSSNEIYNKLPSEQKNIIITIASRYLKGACSDPSSYVGTVASMLCNNNSAFYHDYSYYFPIKKRNDDGFRLK